MVTARRVVAALALLVAALPMTGTPSTASAAVRVDARDNFFSPRELHVDPGDTVVWENTGFRVHTVTSDTGLFDSGNMGRGDTFEFKFRKEGYFFYHCKHHGSEKSGMWGVVVVGDPPPASRRTRVFVPGDFQTIRRAASLSEPGSTIVVRPGIYEESVIVRTPDLVIKGVDRFRTVVHGGDAKQNGIFVDGVDDVIIKNMTVRNYLGAGVVFENADTYTVERVDLIKNRTYGVNATGSSDGAVRKSFVWGSGDSGVRIAHCFACSAIVRSVRVGRSYMGIAVLDAGGVVVINSVLKRNGTGIVALTHSSPEAPTTSAVTIRGNRVKRNNYSGVPAAGISQTYGIPFGTGIWLAGAAVTNVTENIVETHHRYGILVTRALDGSISPVANEVRSNSVSAAGIYDLAWDGAGQNNCFTGNSITGATGPPDIQIVYSCDARPFTGTPFEPVAEDVAAAVADTERDQWEPPEPTRPRCQKGTAGCRR